jgi:hypothetical protein
MLIELNPQDANFLRESLETRLRAMQNEIAHTDKRDLRRMLAADADRLRDLISRFST